ncbi:hypothetical protein M758_5G118400, partial [Ceratodon purpureus]
ISPLKFLPTITLCQVTEEYPNHHQNQNRGIIYKDHIVQTRSRIVFDRRKGFIGSSKALYTSRNCTVNEEKLNAIDLTPRKRKMRNLPETSKFILHKNINSMNSPSLRNT